MGHVDKTKTDLDLNKDTNILNIKCLSILKDQ